MPAALIPFEAPLRGTDGKSTERRIAHRFLDAILDNGDVPLVDDLGHEMSPFADGGEFTILLHARYHCMMHQKLRRKHQLTPFTEDQEYRGPRFTVQLRDREDDKGPDGFILGAGHIVSFEKRRFLVSAGGSRAVAYKVIRTDKELVTLAVYFGFYQPGFEDDGWWYKQLIDLDRSSNRFRCPLCGDTSATLFLSGDVVAFCMQEHFGCVPCMTTLHPDVKRVYEAVLKTLKTLDVEKP